MGIENTKCNSCGGTLEITRSINGTMRYEKIKCLQCGADGSTIWSMVGSNGKTKGTLA